MGLVLNKIVDVVNFISLSVALIMSLILINVWPCVKALQLNIVAHVRANVCVIMNMIPCVGLTGKITIIPAKRNVIRC